MIRSSGTPELPTDLTTRAVGDGECLSIARFDPVIGSNVDHDTGAVAEPGEVVRHVPPLLVALSGQSGLLFRRNSITGSVEAITRTGTWGSLSTDLHSSQ